MAQSDLDRNLKSWNRLKASKTLVLDDISDYNLNLVKSFLFDFEIGVNTPRTRKGKRMPGTLLKLHGFCKFFSRNFKKNFDTLSKYEIHNLFEDMSQSKITKLNGTKYKDIGDFIKNFKTFWGWLIAAGYVNRDRDISEDLCRSSYKGDKASWVFLSHEEMKILIDSCNSYYKPLLLFLFDTGLRPQELMRIRACFINDDKTLWVPEFYNGEKVSKTFERTIKLKHSFDLISQFMKINGKSGDDLLIDVTAKGFVSYLRRRILFLIEKGIFKDKITLARKNIKEFKLYDVRHIACCYWLDQYRTNKDLMYRMGWKKEDKVFYYSEFLGRRDKIDDDDMLTKEDKRESEVVIEGLHKSLSRAVSKISRTDKVIALITKHIDLPESVLDEIRKL